MVQIMLTVLVRAPTPTSGGNLDDLATAGPLCARYPGIASTAIKGREECSGFVLCWTPGC